MSERGRGTAPARAQSQMDVSHLRREARTALELAVVALGPSEFVDRLAMCAGLLEALLELPADSPQVIAILPQLVARTRAALDDWQRWQHEHLEGKIPRG